jgi:diguanylate cyclase (GGDEF)-like protein
VSLSVLVLGNQPAYRKKLHDTFAGNAQFEVLDISGREEDLRADSMAFHSVQLVAFGGSLDCEQWELIQKVRNRNHLLPVLVVAKGKDKSVQDTEMLLRSLSPTQSSADLLGLAKKMCDHSSQLQKHQVASSQSGALGGLAGDFFQSLDIHSVLDKTLLHFGSKILCSDLHWIHWDEVQHLAHAESESLSLELETKYHKTPRLRSWRGEQDIEHAVKLVRQFPLAKKMNHLIEGGYLVLNQEGTQHLMFPLKGSKNQNNLSCLLIEDLHDGEPEFIVKMMRDTLAHLALHIEFSYQFYEAMNLSYIDDLTELYNQRYLPKVLDSEISRAQRNSQKFGVLFMDVDHFKKINDSKGHWIGSKLLVEIGKVIKNDIRSCDYGFRYGGDEYVVVLVDTDTEGAKLVAERLRSKIENSKFIIDGAKVSLTISIGLACYPDHATTRQEVIQMADEAMYVGKNSSRNIVLVAS